MAEKKIQFLATFPDTQSAISMHGSGGMRIILEIPDIYLVQEGNALELMMFRGKAMNVTVSVAPTGPAPIPDKKESWT